MVRTKTSIPSLVQPGLDFGSKVGGVVDGIEDLARALTELKASSDDMTVVETAGAYAFSGIRVTRTTPQTFVSDLGGFWVPQNTVFAAGGWVRSGDRVVVPTGVTRVLMSAIIQWEANSTGDRQANLFQQAVAVTALSLIRATVAGETVVFISSGIFEVVAGQFLQLRVIHGAGGDLDVLPALTYLSVYALDG